MKIAVISDIHANIEALRAVLNDIDGLSVDKIYCTGDLVGYGPKPNEVIELIRAKRIDTVMGNYDDAVAYNLPVCGCNYKSDAERERGEKSLSWTITHITAENKKFLRELPEVLSLNLEKYNLLLFHGSPRALNEYLNDVEDEDLFNDITRDYPADIYIYGHTHVPYVKKAVDKLFVNVGSVGLPKDGNPDACYVIVEIKEFPVVTIHRVLYSADITVSDIIEAGLPQEFAQIVKLGKPIL